MKDRPREAGMQEMKATVWIGKLGLTSTVIDEVVQQLKKRRRIKVKWLHNTEVDPIELAGAADARLVETRGRTAILERRKTE